MADPHTQHGRGPDRRWSPGRLAAMWGPPLVYLGLIFWLSSLARPLGSMNVGRFDKLAHFVEYGILGLLLARGIAGSLGRPTFRRVLLFGAVAALAYGVTDEVHQAFVPGREPDGWDLLADAAGGTLGAALWAIRFRPAARASRAREEPTAG